MPKELVGAGITSMAEANRYLPEVCLLAFNAKFSQLAAEPGSAFVPFAEEGLADILCEQYERSVGKDNCVQFEGLKLQIPTDRHRMHYMKVLVRAHRYSDSHLAVFHGPRKLAEYDAKDRLFATN